MILDLTISPPLCCDHHVLLVSCLVAVVCSAQVLSLCWSQSDREVPESFPALLSGPACWNRANLELELSSSLGCVAVKVKAMTKRLVMRIVACRVVDTTFLVSFLF